MNNATIRTRAESESARSGPAGRRRSAVALAVLAAVALTSACAAEQTTPSATPPASSPAAPATSAAPPATSPAAPAAAPAAAPEVFGTEFQPAPEHDWSKGRPPPFEGVLRGWLTSVDDDGVAEYEPIRFTQSGGEDGHFEGPPEGDVVRYLAPVAQDVEFLAAGGCDGTAQTYDRATGLATESCPRRTLIDNVREAAALNEENAFHPALITTENGRIVKVVEIFWQGGG
ncbi:hypothetical protein [Microtetraspora sp. NBRC 13810]|uniref:hypothetical protein n=1 Tax=Microtetraspora sp. NBRC 13810 TaxID=3030990 RepID=UPI002553AEB9|nr:hypothetical protein [Microtetraspora sp. NBRC 13810]